MKRMSMHAICLNVNFIIFYIKLSDNQSALVYKTGEAVDVLYITHVLGVQKHYRTLRHLMQFIRFKVL